MKRSIGARLGVILVALAVLATTASACTPPAAKLKINWVFFKLSLGSPGPGVRAGENATIVYLATGLPNGGVIRLQKGSGSGATTTWTTISSPRVSPLGVAQIVKPPLGRNSYRLAAFDAKGHLLASVGHGLDVYRNFTFSQITTRPVSSVKMPGGQFFNYVYQAEIFLAHTSCRSVSGLDVFNAGPVTREIQFTHTIGDTDRSVVKQVAVTSGNDFETLFQPSLHVTPGEDFDIHVLNNATLGSTVYGDGIAQCFTGTGRF